MSDEREDDLVNELRAATQVMSNVAPRPDDGWLTERAADEIERLRAENLRLAELAEGLANTLYRSWPGGRKAGVPNVPAVWEYRAWKKSRELMEREAERG